MLEQKNLTEAATQAELEHKAKQLQDKVRVSWFIAIIIVVVIVVVIVIVITMLAPLEKSMVCKVFILHD